MRGSLQAQRLPTQNAVMHRAAAWRTCGTWRDSIRAGPINRRAGWVELPALAWPLLPTPGQGTCAQLPTTSHAHCDCGHSRLQAALHPAPHSATAGHFITLVRSTRGHVCVLGDPARAAAHAGPRALLLGTRSCTWILQARSTWGGAACPPTTLYQSSPTPTPAAATAGCGTA